MRQFFLILLMLFTLYSCIPKDENESPMISSNPTDELNPLEHLNIVMNMISFPENIHQNLNLVYEILGVDIQYESTNTNIITHDGIINQPLFDEIVEFRVLLTYASLTETIIFQLKIKAREWTDMDIIEQDVNQLILSNDEVDNDLILPTVGKYGSLIRWQSSHPHIISNQGKYYAPVDSELITLTATFIFESHTRTKVFQVIAKSIPDSTKVAMAYEMLVLDTNISKDIVLPLKGYFGVHITWQSSHPEILSTSGKFNMPIGSVLIRLTATITSNQASIVKEFDLMIHGHDPITYLDLAFLKLELNEGIEVLFESMILPTTILNHISIFWESSDESILSNTGEFNIPILSSFVSLTAILKISDLSIEKTFTYFVVGSSDITSDQIDQKLLYRTIQLDFPVLFDQNEDLTLGTFDNLIQKENYLVLSGNNVSGSYTSPILISNPFTRINLMWGSITHPKAKSQMHIRYLGNNGMTDWIFMGSWGYGGSNQPPNITLNLPFSSTQIQYKITLTRDNANISSPRLHSVSLNYVFVEPKLDYDLSLLPRKVFYDVPQLRQADTEDTSLWNNICWGTSISMMLQYHSKLLHRDVPHSYYAPLIRLGTTRYGTTKNDIGATQFGIGVKEIEFHSIEMLLYALYHEGPVIVGVSKGTSPTGKFGPLTFDSGHVIVVVGYEILDDGSILIIVNDPAVSWIREPFIGNSVDFMMVWDRGGAILNPLSK